MQTLKNPCLGGMIAQRLLSWAIAFPIVLSWVTFQGEKMGWYDRPFSYVLQAILTSLILSILIWWNARSLNKIQGSYQQIEQELQESERQQIEEALRQSEARYRAIVENQTELVCRFRDDCILTFVNDSYCRFYGQTREELLGSSILAQVPPEEHEKIEEKFNWFSQQLPGVHIGEHTVVAASGELRWVQWTTKAIFDATGSLVEYQSVGRDITDRKQIEIALEQSNAYYQSLGDALPQCIYRKDREGRLIFANKAFLDTLKMTLEECLGLTVYDLHPKELADKHTADDRRVIDTGEVIDIVEKYKLPNSDRTLYIQVVKAPVRDAAGNIIGTQGLFWDISERENAEEKLRQSEARLAAAQKVAHIGNWEYDLLTEKITWSEELFRIFNRDKSQKEPTYAELLYKYHPIDGEILRQAVERTIATGEPYELDIKLIRDDGSIGYLEARGEAVFDEERRVVRLFGTGQDISDRKHLEELLRSQAQRDQALNRVIQAIRNSLDLNTIFSTAASEIGTLLKVDQVDIVQYLPERQIWLPVAEYLTSSELPSKLGKDIPDEGNLVAAKLKRLEIVRVDDTSTLKDEVNSKIAKSISGAWLLMPLFFNNSAWGSLSLLKSQPYQWRDSDVELAREVADQLAIAIQQSQLYQQLAAVNQELKQLANLDGLTQIANRRRFDEYLKNEWLRLRREQAPLSLILFDVDYFKRYNDTYGHLAGDDCLRQIANALSKVTRRPADLVARYGGEEFAAILPNTDTEGAVYLAELIRQKMQQLAIPHHESLVSDRVTVSLGVVSIVPNPESSPEDLINAADSALYSAKQQGRDRVSVCASV